MKLLEPFNLTLTPRQAIELYLHLKRQEDRLSQETSAVLDMLRSRLYTQLSIEEMENLEVYLEVLSAANSARR